MTTRMLDDNFYFYNTLYFNSHFLSIRKMKNYESFDDTNKLMNEDDDDDIDIDNVMLLVVMMMMVICCDVDWIGELIGC